jgi:hypothetical protein
MNFCCIDNNTQFRSNATLSRSESTALVRRSSAVVSYEVPRLHNHQMSTLNVERAEFYPHRWSRQGRSGRAEDPSTRDWHVGKPFHQMFKQRWAGRVERCIAS